MRQLLLFAALMYGSYWVGESFTPKPKSVYIPDVKAIREVYLSSPSPAPRQPEAVKNLRFNMSTGNVQIEIKDRALNRTFVFE